MEGSRNGRSDIMVYKNFKTRDSTSFQSVMDVVVKNHSEYTWTSHESSPVWESVEREDSEFKDVFLSVLVGSVVNEFYKYLPSFYSNSRHPWNKGILAKYSIIEYQIHLYDLCFLIDIIMNMHELNFKFQYREC